MNNLKSIKKEIIRPDFLDLCDIVHIHHEIHTDNKNKEYLLLKITFNNPKSIGLFHFLSYFKTLNLTLIDWDEQTDYDFDINVYTDFQFIFYDKNIIEKYKSFNNASSEIFNYTHTLFNMNIPSPDFQLVKI